MDILNSVFVQYGGKRKHLNKIAQANAIYDITSGIQHNDTCHCDALCPLQVVIAVDDSRSMRENKCGIFAMEAVTLVSKALGRLEVGEVAVVGFGGAGSIKALHPLGRPLTDADGPRILSQLCFDQAGASSHLSCILKTDFHPCLPGKKPSQPGPEVSAMYHSA